MLYSLDGPALLAMEGGIQNAVSAATGAAAAGVRKCAGKASCGQQ